MFKHWFTPQVIKIFKSKFNSDVQLIKFGSSLRLDMGHLTQSGSIITSIWTKAFKKLLSGGFYPESILVLGLGGGSVVKLISRKWPVCQITAIEIDPVVIKIAQKYFDIGKIKNLTIVNADAVKYQTLNIKYSIILVDCYQGDQIPSQFRNISFLKKLKSRTRHLFLNRLYWNGYKIQTNQFIQKLKSNFNIQTSQTPSNLVISLK